MKKIQRVKNENDSPCTTAHGRENHTRQREKQACVKYEPQGALLQETILREFDPDDPEVEILASVLLGHDRIEQLSVVIRKGKAAKEIRLI